MFLLPLASSAGVIWVQVSSALSAGQRVLWRSGKADGQCLWVAGSDTLQEPAGGVIEEAVDMRRPLWPPLHPHPLWPLTKPCSTYYQHLSYAGDWIFFLHSLISYTWVDVHMECTYYYLSISHKLIYLLSCTYIFILGIRINAWFRIIMLNTNVFFVKLWDNVQTSDSCSVLKHLKGLRAFSLSSIFCQWN